MATIPLVALDAKPPASPDLLEQYGKLMAIQGQQQQNQQQQAMAPLQQQQEQQAVQSGAADLQQKQQALADQKAITTSMQQWDGKDYNDIYPLIIKNGGSGTAVIGLKGKVLEQQQAASTALKNNAQAGEAQMAADKQRGDLLEGALSPLIDPKQTPDEQLPQALQQTVQQLTQSGVLDPQHAQTAAQIVQLAQTNPDQARQQLGVIQKSNLAHSQIMEDAAKQATTAQSQSETAKNTAEAAYYQQNPQAGAPGVPVDTVEMNSYLENNPSKTPQDFVAWKAKQSPMAMVIGNQLGGANNSQALDFEASNYLKTGQMPPEMSRSPGTVTAIIQRAAQMNAQNGGGSLASNTADYKANSESLKQLQTNYDQVQAFEQTAEKNMGLLQQTAAKIPDLGLRFANVPVRMLNSQMLGTDNMASFKAALATAQTEAAKVLNSAKGNGVLSDSSRHELQDIIDGNVPYSAMVASLNTLKQDMSNRTQSYQAQIGDIQQRIGGGQSQQPSSTPQASYKGDSPQALKDSQPDGATGTTADGRKVIKKNGQWQIQP